MKGKQEPRELFASPADVVKAHLIVEEVLGRDFDVDYMTFPKSTGAMGDEGVLGRTVWIIPENPAALKTHIDNSIQVDKETLEALADPDPQKLPPPSCNLGEVALRICNETRSACRVVLDITPHQLKAPKPKPAPITPIHGEDPERAKHLHNNLLLAHQAIISGWKSEGQLKHSTRSGDWEITLYTSRASELQAASLTRLGQELYSFMRTGDTAWGTVSGNHLFANAHFSNLVTMAVSHGLRWVTSRDLR